MSKHDNFGPYSDEFSEHTPEEWDKIKGAIRRSFEPSLRKRLQSFFPWFYAPRRAYLPNTVISFTSGQGIAPGQGLFDPIHRTWQVPVALYGVDRNSSILGDYESERWLCEQYRELPSRWESLKERIAWYWKYVSRLYFCKSDQAVVDDMRRRNEL